MPKTTELGLEASFEVADAFAQASAAILDFRVENNSSLDPNERSALEKAEDQLDHFVVIFRAHGIELIGAKAAQAAEDLKAAVEDAKAKLKKIAKIKKAIAIATSLVALAVALLSKDVKAVIAAVEAVNKAKKGPQKPAEEMPAEAPLDA